MTLARGQRERLPQKRRNVRYKFRIGGQGVFLQLDTYPDGRLGEIWVDIGRVSSPLQTIFHAWAKEVSKGLQYGIPLSVVLKSYDNALDKVSPNGPVDCEALPAFHGSIYPNIWKLIVDILRELTDKEGRLK